MEILSLWLCIIFFFMQYQTGFSSLNNNTIRNRLCRQDQKLLLLQLRQQLSPEGELPENYYKTMYWNQSWNCCLWDGISCDLSGRVIGLDLNSGGLKGSIESNSSLFRLAHLRKLNLAFNYFGGSKVSFKYGWLNRLTHLNLSGTGLSGQIPMEFYHLSNLVSLDLSWNRDLNCDIKLLFGNMTKIRALKLAENNISSEMPTNMSSFLTHLDLSATGIHGKLPVTIFEKPYLQVLRLADNYGLKGSLPKSLNRSNVHFIRELDLSRTTNISGRLPDSTGFMNNLNYMRLSGCNFWGPIPESIGNITEITEINLLWNEFSGRVPSTISNLPLLTYLDLSRNHLEGQLPDAFSGLQKLTFLDLSKNNLVGIIPSSLTNMSQLERLDISSNALTGPFPSKSGNGLQRLSFMNLFNNSIHGMIPSWLLSLPSLERLDLNSNRLTGQTGIFNRTRLHFLDLSNNQLNIELESFYNLSEIESLFISHNAVTEPAREIVNFTLSNLLILDLSSCEIKEFPDFLRNSPSLRHLDLSNNKIHDPIPSWFSSNPWQQLSYLNLSTNYLTYAGYEPWRQLENLKYLDLHSNSLRGTFPSSICNMSQLSILDLSNNKLKGKIPECIGNLSSSLGILDLKRNEFNGKIPTTIASAGNILGDLGLNGNHLEGPMPRSLANCTQLKVLDLGNNKIQDIFPWWLETLPKLKILILRSNRFHGSIRPPLSNDSFSELQILDLSHNNFTGLLPEKLFAGLLAMKNQDQMARDDLYLGQVFSIEEHQYSLTLSVKGADVETRVLRILTSVDLSSNNFYGHIPESIAYLYSLRLLNLSHNSINGSILPALGSLTKLEHLDLSSNQLTGGIPQTLTNLTFLEVLNLSHNHLTGPIPQGNQFWTFSNDSYDGNSGLCGPPLTKSCGAVPPPSVVSEEDDDDSAGLMTGFTWEAVVMGYGCGIVLGFILGNVMISTGKPKWFAGFYYAEEANCLYRRRKRGRMHGAR